MKRNFKSFFIISIFLFAAGILASAETYTWTGIVDAVFTNPNNWKDSSNNTPTWGSTLPAATYRILNTPSRIPYLPNDVTLATGTTIIEVGTAGTSASLKLGDFSFGGSVTIRVNEKGTLGLSGTPAQITLFNNSQITLQPDSTVWYYGGYPNNIFPGPYQNFVVTGNIKADSLTVEKTTSIGNNNPVTIKVKTQTYKGAITVQKDVTFDAETSVTFTAAANVNAGPQNLSFIGGGAVNMQGVTAGTVDATGASSLTVNGTVNLSGDLKAKNLTVNTATVSASKVEVGEAATVNTAATITAATQTYNGTVTVNADTTFNAATSLTFGAAGTIGGTGSIIVPGNGAVSIQKNINLTGSTSKFEQTGTGSVNIGVNASSITAATQIYNGTVTLNRNTTFSAATALTFTNTVSAGGFDITFNGAGAIQTNVVTAKNITATGAAGTWTSANDITLSGDLRTNQISQTGGTLLFNGSGVQTLQVGLSSQIHHLKNNGKLNLDSDITIADTLENNGIFTANGKTVTFNGLTSQITGTSEPTFFGLAIASGAVLTLGQNIGVAGTVTNNGTFDARTHNTTVTFNGQNSKITGTGSSEPAFWNLTVANSAKLTLESNIKIAGTFTKNGGFYANNNTTVTFTNLTSTITAPVNSEPTFWNLTIAGSAGLQLGSNIKVAGTFTNNGSFTHNGKAVTFVGFGSEITGTATETEFSTLAIDKRESPTPPPYNKVTLANGKKIKIKVFKNIYKGTFNAGTSTEITLTEEFDNSNGTLEPGTSTVKLEPSGNTVTIKGASTGTNPEDKTKFHNLKLESGGGKTLTINGKISVNGDLKLEGTSAGSLLTIAGGTNSPGIKLSANQTGNGKWLNVHTNIPMIPESGGHTYTVTESKAYEVSGFPLSGGNPKNWVFTNYLGSLTWTGNTDNNWTEKNNWSPPVGVPGIDTDVTIPAGIQESKYPKLTANVKAKTISLVPGAKLDLADYIITKSTSVSDFTPITNNGTLRMKGTFSLMDPKGQKEWLESTQITHGENSVIEYYSTANNPLWRGPYQNLTVSEGRTSLTPIAPSSGSVAADLTVKKTFTVAADAGSNFTVTAKSQLYKQTVSLKKKTTFHSFAGTGTVFKGSVSASGIDIAFSGNGLIKTESTVTAKDITVDSGTGAWTSSGTITAHNITVNRSWTSSADVTSGGNIEVDNFSHNNTWIASSGDIKLKGNLTAAQFNQTGGTLTFNGTGTPEQELKFTGTGDKNINNLTIDNGSTPPASNTKVKLLTSVSIAGTLTNKGTFNANGKDITLDGSCANSGTFNTGTGNTITFNGALFSNSGTFNAGTNNTVTLTPSGNSVIITGTGNASDTKFHNLELLGAGGKTLTVNGKISVAGNLDISGSSAASKLTVKGAGEITLTADYTAVPPSSPLPSPPPAGYFLNVCLNIPIADGYTYTVRNSTPANNSGTPILSGSPENWIFEDYSGTLTWTAGAASPTDKTKWNNPKNWSPNCTPGIDTEAIIPVVNTYPILTANVNAKTVTVDSGAQLNLAGFVITDTSNTARLINNGLLKMTGTSAQKAWFEQTAPTDQISLGTDSTVQYQSGSSDAVFSGPYENLIVQRSITAPSPLTVNKKTTVNAAATITAATQIYTGNVEIKANTEFNASTALTFKHTVTGSRKITLSGTGSTNIGNNITLTGGNGIIEQTGSGSVIIGDASVLPSKITVTAPTQTYSGSVTVKTDAEFNAQTSLTFASSASLTAQGRNIDFVVSNDSTVTLPTLTVADAVSPVVANSLVKIASKTGNSFLTVTGITDIKPLTSNPSATVEIDFPKQVYEGQVKANHNARFIAADTLLFKNAAALISAAPKKDVELKSPDVEIRGSVDVKNLTIGGADANGCTAVKFADSSNPSSVLPGTVSANDIRITLAQTGKLIIKEKINCAGFVQTTAASPSEVRVQIGHQIAASSVAPKFDAPFIFITDSATVDPSSSTGANGIDCKPDCTFFIAKNINLANTLSCGNFVLFGGTVTFGSSSGGITATGDIVLFGGNYKADDAGPIDPSDVPGLFKYIHPKRTGLVSDVGYSAKTSLAQLPGVLPDEGALPKETDASPSFSGAFASLNGKTLKAGKNFYANGMDLRTSGSWTLDIPNNDSAMVAFAEAYFTKVSNCTVIGGGFVAAAEGCTVTSSSAWKTDRPLIKAYTVSDDTIYVRFVSSENTTQSRKIENTNNEIKEAVKHIKFSNNQYGFTKAYKDRGCTTSTDGQGDLSEFYIRIENDTQRWNTDATGTSAGNADSTCRGGYNGNTPRHWNNTVDLTIPKALGNLYASLRDEHKNRIKHYSGTNKFTAVEDRCPPVLAAVYTGQEQHVQGSSQPVYDAHNFIEFRYSEPVYIGKNTPPSSVSVPETAQNILAENIGRIPNSSSGITVTGFASFSGGSIDVGNFTSSNPSEQDKVHALYRQFSTTAGSVPLSSVPSEAAQECRIRVSIAGYYDSANKWIGYIKSAQTPSGTVTVLSGADIRTRGPSSVPSDLEDWEMLDTTFTPRLYTASSGSNAYVSYHPLASSWDTSPPVFAAVANNHGEWNSGNTAKEIAVYSALTQFADKMEFHFFDNTPTWDPTEPWWQTPSETPPEGKGWSDVAPRARYDSFGGSRRTGNNRTTGGIRACTLPSPAQVQNIFSFNATHAEFSSALEKFRGTDPDFTLSLAQKTENHALFGPLPSGFLERDSLYLQLKITPISTPLAFPITETFTVGYQAFDSTHPNGGHITDLAGNIMHTFSGGASINASPPNIALTVAPIGLQQIYVLFTAQINTEPDTLAKIPHNLEIVDLPTGSSIAIDPAIAARVRTDTKSGTGVVISLTAPVSYKDLSAQAKLRVKDYGGSVYIRPKTAGYPALVGHRHVISDFAVNVIRPLFAYDEKALDDGTGFLTQNLYGDGSYATRVFDGSGAPGNTVLEKEDITLNVAVENVVAGDPLSPQQLELYIDNSPNPASESVDLNKAANLGSRVWLPKITTGLPPHTVSGLSVLSPEENTCSANEVILRSPTIPGGFNYTFNLLNNPLSPGSLNYSAGSRAGFLFALKNGGSYITIDHDCDNTTDNVPLYALRLKDPNDPASIDLWSFDIASVKRQAGGVSILNNVINASTGEQTLIKVDTERAGSLSVIVMTLDGDVLKILHSGRVEKGEHIYKWDGRNANGEPVARGLYFIRIVGPDIDETRKVMAVRE